MYKWVDRRALNDDRSGGFDKLEYAVFDRVLQFTLG